MSPRFLACTALILCTSVAFAQEAPPPSASGGGQSGGTPVIAPSAGMETPLQSGGEAPAGAPKKPADASSAAPEGFSLPGGSGYAPLNFTPGQGQFDRKPLTFSTSLQQGYDDNVDSSSGGVGRSPVKGSFITTASEGMDLLISQSRLGLSLGANLGAQYYWDRASDQLTPNGGLNLIFAYKFSPRAQFSAVVNSSYTTTPTLTVVNGLTQSNGTGYLVTNSKFDYLYRWTPRFSTDTSYSANGTWYQAASQKASNYIDQTVGQSFRYAYSQIVTGVFEGRFADIQYNSLPGTTTSVNDSTTYYGLVGADVTLSRRLSGSVRVGETTRDYKTAGMATSSSPYAETSVNYTLSRLSLLAFDARYGYEDGGSGSQSSKSLRAGINYTRNFSSKLRANIGVNYSHADASSGPTIAGAQDAVSATLGAQYALSKNLSVFGNFNRMQSFSSSDAVKYAKDVYYLGATYQY